MVLLSCCACCSHCSNFNSTSQLEPTHARNNFTVLIGFKGRKTVSTLRVLLHYGFGVMSWKHKQGISNRWSGGRIFPPPGRGWWKTHGGIAISCNGSHCSKMRRLCPIVVPRHCGEHRSQHRVIVFLLLQFYSSMLWHGTITNSL